MRRTAATSGEFSTAATTAVLEELILEMSCEDLHFTGSDVARQLRAFAHDRYIPKGLDGGSPLVQDVMRQYLRTVNWDEVAVAVNAFSESFPRML